MVQCCGAWGCCRASNYRMGFFKREGGLMDLVLMAIIVVVAMVATLWAVRAFTGHSYTMP